MKIVRSTSSHATAGGSNETRETLRSEEIQAKGVVSPDDEGVSPKPERVELESASLHENYRRPTSRRWGSLSSTRKQRMEAHVESVGVKGESAHRKNCQINWEILLISRQKWWQSPLGINNRGGCSGRKSDGPIVAMKRGNACGAKGPYCKHAYINEERAA